MLKFLGIACCILTSLAAFGADTAPKKNPLLPKLVENGLPSNKFTECYPSTNMNHVKTAFDSRDVATPNLTKTIPMITHKCDLATKFEDLEKCDKGKSGIVSKETIKVIGFNQAKHLRHLIDFYLSSGELLSVAFGRDMLDWGDESSPRILARMMIKRPEDFVILNNNSTTDKRSLYREEFCQRSLNATQMTIVDKKSGKTYTLKEFDRVGLAELKQDKVPGLNSGADQIDEANVAK